MTTPDSAETQRLLTQIRAGETAARDELLQRHRPYLQRLIELRLDPRLRPRVDPSDVVQEAQLEAFRRLDDYLEKPILGFRLWLRQIAQDRLLMMRRFHVKAARRAIDRDAPLPDRSSLLLAQQLFAKDPTPSEQVRRRELARRVREAVGQLPPAERDVLVLRNLEGLSNLEVAQVLQTDPATTGRRYGRAVLHLRDLLVDSGVRGSQP